MVEKKMENSYEYYRVVKNQFDNRKGYSANIYY